MAMIDRERMEGLGQRLVAEEVRGRNPWADARRRFLRNKAAVTGLLLLLAVLAFGLFGQHLAAWSNEEIDLSIMGSAAERGGPSLSNGHWFGTDDLGRDLYARTVQGTRVSLLVGVLGAVIAVVIGTLYGAVSGYAGGRTDQIMMRLVDILMSVPYMFILILLLVMFGRSLSLLFVGIGLISWLDMSRIVRGQTLTLKHREFIQAFACASTPRTAWCRRSTAWT